MGRLSLVALGESARAERRRQRGRALGRLPQRGDRETGSASNSPRSEQGSRAGRVRPAVNPTAGRMEVCNGSYGSTGWLGIAQIWLTSGSHITQATTKLNDTYFDTPAYNTPPLATPRRVPGDRARLRARSPGRELQRIRTLARAWTTPATRSGHRRTSTRISTTSTSSSRSIPISTAREAAASRATGRGAGTALTVRRSRRPARRTGTCTSITTRTVAARLTHVFWALG